MIDEPFTDAQRRRLLDLAIGAVPREQGDDDLTAIIARLSGVDTVLIARRAYPTAHDRGRRLSQLPIARRQSE